ncbi:hypothetical protein BDV18DRAFT_2866 [Aspergillus unguis]
MIQDLLIRSLRFPTSLHGDPLLPYPKNHTGSQPLHDSHTRMLFSTYTFNTSSSIRQFLYLSYVIKRIFTDLTTLGHLASLSYFMIPHPRCFSHTFILENFSLRPIASFNPPPRFPVQRQCEGAQTFITTNANASCFVMHSTYPPMARLPILRR